MRKKKDSLDKDASNSATVVPKATKKKKPKREKLPLQCQICGAKSRFKYYNVQSCESCKQFFRRIVMKQKEFHCLKFWTCDLNQGERCRGCRLDKCLRLGMDPSMVNIELTDKLKDFIEKLEHRRRRIMDPCYCKYKFKKPENVEEVQNFLSTDDSDLEDNEKDEEAMPQQIHESPSVQSTSTSTSNLSPSSSSTAQQDFMQNSGQMDWHVATTSSSSSGPSPSSNAQADISMIYYQSTTVTEAQMDLEILQNNPSPWSNGLSHQQLPHFQSLLQMEKRIRKIHFSCTEMAPNYFDTFQGIGELMMRTDNLLANSEKFSPQPTHYWIRGKWLETVQQRGIWARRPVYYIRDLIMTMDFARTIPAYNHLALEDQIALINSFCLSASRMMISFYSMERNAQTMLLPNGMPIKEQFKVGRFAQDKVLEKLSKIVYDLPVSGFAKFAPDKEEFMLLLTLLFLNPATSGLSTAAQQLLKDEAEKCGKSMLQMQQNRLGPQAGALRYMEAMSLLCGCITNAQKYRELLVYLDTVYEQGQFEKVMPKMLVSICMQGPKELPNLLEPF